MLRWLQACHGFAVDGPGGRVGAVVGVVASRDSRHALVLLVRGDGPEAPAPILLVPVDAVTAVRPRERRLVVRDAVPVPVVGGRGLAGVAAAEPQANERRSHGARAARSSDD
jgi:hypothetical protein